MQQNLLKHTLSENIIRMVRITFQLDTSTDIALALQELLLCLAPFPLLFVSIYLLYPRLFGMLGIMMY